MAVQQYSIKAESNPRGREDALHEGALGAMMALAAMIAAADAPCRHGSSD